MSNDDLEVERLPGSDSPNYARRTIELAPHVTDKASRCEVQRAQSRISLEQFRNNEPSLDRFAETYLVPDEYSA